MDILGLSSGELGSGASLVRDGVLRACAREERFTRQRLDPNPPRFAAEHCLREAGRPAAGLSGIAVAGDPADRFTRVLTGTLGQDFPWMVPAFVRSMSAWIGHHLWERDSLSRLLDVDPAAIQYRPRHRCLSAAAVQGAGVDEAAILVVDTVGEWTTTTIARWAEGGAPEDVERFEYPHSLGLLSAAVAMLLGLRPWEGLAPLWDLAAWGRPTLTSRFRRVLQVQDDGAYQIAPGFLRFAELFEPPYGDPWTGAFTDLFGAPRDARRPWPFRAGEAPAVVDTEDQRHADIAASLQVVIEEAMLGLARRAKAKTGAAHLCVAGALAGNAAAIRRLRREAGFASVHVPADPTGLSAGAALLLAAERGAPLSGRAPQPFGGRAWPAGRDLDAVARMDPMWWQRFRRRGTTPVRDARIEVTPELDDDALLGRVVADLAAGRIVGWLEGAFESGPGGLAHRVLLADPRDPAVARRLTERVTGAPAFAPTTLLTPPAAVPALVDEPAPTAGWVPLAAHASAAARAAAPTAVHADGTLRYLPVDAEIAPRLAALLDRWSTSTGAPGLLVADLREAEDPLAASPADALLIFMRTEVDTLVLDQGLVRKELP